MPRNASSHSTFCGHIFVNVSSPLNLAILCQTPYLFHSNHDSDFVSKFNQSMGLIMPTLLVLLHLKYQSTSNPFDTHPYTVGVAVFSLFTYYLARVLHERCSSSRRVSALSLHCMVWFGDISVASLMSLFLSGWIYQPMFYIVFGLISASQFLRKLFVGGTGSGRFSAQRIRHFLSNFCSWERDYDLPRYRLQS